MSDMDPPREDPAAIYARIRARRRTAAAESPDDEPGASVPPASVPPSPAPEPAAFSGGPTGGGAPDPDSTTAAPAATAATAGMADDTAVFPRSATMRFVLDHPVAAAAVGLPLAVLAWRSATSRRLLGAALRLGAQPMVREIARVSMQTAQRLNERPQTRPRRPRP